MTSTGDERVPKRSFWNRVVYRLRVPFGGLLLFNVALGGYFWVVSKVDKRHEAEVGPKELGKAPKNSENDAHIDTNDSFATQLTNLLTPVVPTHSKNKSSVVSEDQQRELFKWILEEKRKVKSANGHEKARIDAEKQVLKEFIRTDKWPPLR